MFTYNIPTPSKFISSMKVYKSHLNLNICICEAFSPISNKAKSLQPISYKPHKSVRHSGVLNEMLMSAC